MGKALYRKYRSKSLAEIIGQEHITQTLGRALKQGTISHAYLFTGPRGTGKTSIARILAHAVNGLPYSEQTHLDIIEIDAASNRRIDEIRELKERVHTAPTSVKYKVYIIDEVHMLTKEAFNALLKTLEEPPDHVIFILATTEAHKVPETIISRTQRFTFKPVSVDKVAAHLKEIAGKEKIKIDDDALQLIAAHGEGSFRDSISLLDQVRHTSSHITLEHIRQAVGQAPDDLLSELMDNLREGSLPKIAGSLAQLQAQGILPPQTARQLSQLLRSNILAANPILPQSQTLQLLHDLAHVGAAQDPGLKLELAIYSAALQHPHPAMPYDVPELPPTAAADNAKVQKVMPKQKAKQEPKQDTIKGEMALNEHSWPLVLAAIKAKHNTLYGITRMATPSFGPGKLTLSFAFAFHKKRLDDSKNRHMLVEIIREATGQDISVVCVLDPSTQIDTMPVADEIPDAVNNVADLETISNIFGSAEVVE